MFLLSQTFILCLIKYGTFDVYDIYNVGSSIKLQQIFSILLEGRKLTLEVNWILQIDKNLKITSFKRESS